MWIRKLEYPRGQTYAIPHITTCFYAGSAIIIGLLIAVNIAIVGNDVVTTLRDSPNNSDDKWWAPKWLPSFMTIPTTPGPCQPFTLPQHSTSVRTNSTLPIFAYTVLNGLGKSQTNTTRWFDTLPYNSEPLRTCTVQNMTALINFQDRGIKVTSHIICDVISKNPNTPRLLKFSTTFSRMANTDLGPDDIIDYISSYAIPRSAAISDAQAVLLAADSPPVKMLGVLDAVGSDLLKATWAQKWRWKIAGDDNEWPDQAAVKWSYQANCSLAGNWTTHRCRNFGENVEGIDMWYSNTKGAQDFNATYFRDMNTTIYNYFTVMRDALHLDLGNIDRENNVFLSQDAFKARVLPDPFMNITAPYVIGRRRPRPFNGTYTPDQFWRTCTWGWGCHNGTWTEAILNNASSAINITNGLPIYALADQGSVVIDVKYVCPAFKVKQTGPLLVSVFIGTFSIYTALYGIFLFVAPRLDERYRKKRGLGRYSDDEEDYGRQYRYLYELYKSPPHSANPYYTVFDPHDQHRTSSESVPRYDSSPYPSYGRSIRKRAGSLPSGAGYFPVSTAPSDEPLLHVGKFNPIAAGRSRDSMSSTVPHGPPMIRTDSAVPGYFDPYLVTPGPPSGARGPR